MDQVADPRSRTDEQPPGHVVVDEELDEHEDQRGTMTLMLLFLVMCVVLWAAVYFLLISRGGG